MIADPIFEERNRHDTRNFDEIFGKALATEPHHILGASAAEKHPIYLWFYVLLHFYAKRGPKVHFYSEKTENFSKKISIGSE